MNYRRVVWMTVLAIALALPIEAATATWNRNPEPTVVAYRLSYGTQSGVHPTSINVGNVISYQFFPPPGQLYYVVVQAIDSGGGVSAKSAEATLDLRSGGANRAPTLTQPANQTSAEGSAVSLALAGSDPDGNPLTYTATGLPSGLAINAATGRISGTPSFTSAATYSVTARVSDGTLSQSRTFSWIITNTNRPPVLAQPANQTSVPNANVSLQLSASDPDGTALTYQATGLPPGATVSASTGLISGRLTASSAGNYNVTATAYDGGLTSTRTFTWSVGSTAGDTDMPVRGDFDGDGKYDPATFRSASGQWRVWRSASGFVAANPISWGAVGDVTVPADYDGDHKTDIAVYRPSNGTWYILFSSTNNQTRRYIKWGIATDRPMPVDYDNDGRADLAVWRSGRFYILLSGSNYTGSVTVGSAVGSAVGGTDIPVRGDFDGDGKYDPATFQSATGWRVWRSASSFVAANPILWGYSSDVPVPADYDGDDKTDIVVYRPSDGTWYILFSSTNNQTRRYIKWGNTTDRPLPVDYDNDGRADLALWRSGAFYILLSGSNYTSSVTVR